MSTRLEGWARLMHCLVETKIKDLRDFILSYEWVWQRSKLRLYNCQSFFSLSKCCISYYFFSLYFRSNIQENVDLIKLQRGIKEKATKFEALQAQYLGLQEVRWGMSRFLLLFLFRSVLFKALSKHIIGLNNICDPSVITQALHWFGGRSMRGWHPRNRRETSQSGV